MGAVPFCPGFLSEPRIAQMGGMAHRRFVAMPPSAWGLPHCFVRGWAGGRGLRLNRGLH